MGEVSLYSYHLYEPSLSRTSNLKAIQNLDLPAPTKNSAVER